ncbi:hypothetical protein LCI18_012597 [Fusarium solani-melongenae]|uniref:Uncharacterized protein n=1 Tax=Fusarium solani subsp. cucurbitae TaxID=2747967 RepID=A0ACD3ZKN8_FUSSC|nr:hypothetical protein LCI18_012597 [Fusarium solani-melongenae]
MSSPLSSYVFDEYGMTWITCDLCSGSFQREAQICKLCQGSKVRRVSYDYLARASAPPQVQNQGGNPPAPPKRDNNNNHGSPPSNQGVYSRRSS